jgi:hypothetical protein
MLLCAVASSLQVHGDSFRDRSGRSLDSPEGQWSIGFPACVLFTPLGDALVTGPPKNRVLNPR